MAEETAVQSTADANSSVIRQKKKRKWDQPAEGVIAAAAFMPGMLPFINPAGLSGMALPGMLPPFTGLYPSMFTPAVSASAQHNAVAIVQKINQDLASKGLLPQVKIQDEIAREVVINDAEPNVRYKLTKRQTQEEIQVKTGAVVITRGKYKPPNAPVDHEKPLYLHISAGAHLKETVERIKAVDMAAALVEEMLRQGRQVMANSTGQHSSPLSTTVFVDFESGSPFDIMNRIRGPNDQYINHIMNETGATVVVKGGSCDISCSEDIPQPLHLLISADNPKSLDDARSLVENLLETIRSEILGPRPPYFPPHVSYNLQQPIQIGNNLERGSVCPVPFVGQPSDSASRAIVPPIIPDYNATRLPPKVYSAVPPPKQLLGDDVEATEKGTTSTEVSETKTNSSAPIASTPFSASNSIPTYGGYPAVSTTYIPGAYPQQSYGMYPQVTSSHEPYVGYSAYTGVYPQASPLQQVALALQRPQLNPASVQHFVFPVGSQTYTKPLTSVTKGQGDKQEKQKRKFQEAPVQAKEHSVDQVLDPKDQDVFKQQVMPPPRAAAPPTPGSMPPPPPRAQIRAGKQTFSPLGQLQTGPQTSSPLIVSTGTATLSVSSSMPPPPLRAKSAANTVQTSLPLTDSTCNGLKMDPVSVPSKANTTGLKLVEYGEDDEDEENSYQVSEEEKLDANGKNREDQNPYVNGKPFWAV